MTNNILMSENLKSFQVGSESKVNVLKSLVPQKAFNNNSWFSIGHFNAEGHILNYLFHIMQIPNPGQEDYYLSIISITDETDKFYDSIEFMFKKSECEITYDRFSIKLPNGKMEGTWDDMFISCEMPGFSINTNVSAYSYPLMTKKTGRFSLLNMEVTQFSIPHMKTMGAITIKNKTYSIINGETWFDRQWDNISNDKFMKWSWLAITLEDGTVLSLFDTDVPGKEDTFGTILHNDGSLTNIPLKPFSEYASDYWLSPKTEQYYPTHWTITIPQINCNLDIQSIMKEQEIISHMPNLHKYEASCTVSGTYEGKQITGHAVAELIGNWSKNNLSSTIKNRKKIL